MQTNKWHLYFFGTGHHGMLGSQCGFQRLTILHPPLPFSAQTGSACLGGWPSPKPEVYTASGSVQIKTAIIDLGLDSALFEKMEGGLVGWVMSSLV